MATLTKEEILAADDLPTQRVKVEKWGGEVIVRSFTGVERDEFEQQLARDRTDDVKDNLFRFETRLIALTLVDETGKRLFTIEEAEAIGRKNGSVLRKLADVAMSLNALSESEVEVLAKN